MAFANQIQLPCPNCTCPGGGDGGGGGTVINVPNCFCPAIPSILAVRSCNGNQAFGFVQSAVVTYGPAPPGILQGVAWWSTLLMETLTGNGFYYQFGCVYNGLFLNYWPAPGSPLEAGTLAQWFIGTIGNSCSPFSLTIGCLNIYSTMPPFSCLTVGSVGAAPACSSSYDCFGGAPAAPIC